MLCGKLACCLHHVGVLSNGSTPPLRSWRLLSQLVMLLFYGCPQCNRFVWYPVETLVSVNVSEVNEFWQLVWEAPIMQVVESRAAKLTMLLKTAGIQWFFTLGKAWCAATASNLGYSTGVGAFRVQGRVQGKVRANSVLPVPPRLSGVWNCSNNCLPLPIF